MNDKILKTVTLELIKHNFEDDSCCELCDIEEICGDSGLDVRKDKMILGHCEGGYWRVKKQMKEEKSLDELFCVDCGKIIKIKIKEYKRKYKPLTALVNGDIIRDLLDLCNEYLSENGNIEYKNIAEKHKIFIVKK